GEFRVQLRVVRRIAARDQQEAITLESGVDVVRQRRLIRCEASAGERHPIAAGGLYPPGAEDGAPHLFRAPAVAAEVFDERVVAAKWLPARERPECGDRLPRSGAGPAFRAPPAEEGGEGGPVPLHRGPYQEAAALADLPRVVEKTLPTGPLAAKP